jgi:transcriptional regulator GlxA family with amidase domain
VDRERYPCSGGVAPLDLIVHLLGMPPGSRSVAAHVLESPSSRQSQVKSALCKK